MFSKKTEIINFRTFMKDEPKMRDHQNAKVSHFVTARTLKSYSFIPIHPAMFIDTTFIMIAGGVVLVALLERTLANHGHVAFAEAIHTFLKVVFPIVGLAAMYFLITQLHF